MTNRNKTILQVVMMLFCITGLSAVQAAENKIFRGHAGQPIISFYQSHGMVEGSKYHTDMAIYATGKVIVTVPDYMKGAGVWQYQMSAKKLDAVVKMLDSYGVMKFDSKAVAEQKTVIQRSSDIRYAVMDATVSTFVFNFAHFGGQTDKNQPFSHTTAWPQVNVDAKRFPQLIALSSLARAEKLMLSLTKHERYDSVRVAGEQ